jgi:hypothetical protein
VKKSDLDLEELGQRMKQRKQELLGEMEEEEKEEDA